MGPKLVAAGNRTMRESHSEQSFFRETPVIFCAICVMDAGTVMPIGLSWVHRRRSSAVAVGIYP